jgi:hypothetical protein
VLEINLDFWGVAAGRRVFFAQEILRRSFV